MDAAFLFVFMAFGDRNEGGVNKDIEKQAALCRKAFKGVKVGAVVQHCHHGQWLEVLTETPETRIAYILEQKPVEEQAERLRRFRPIGPEERRLPAALRTAAAAWQKSDAALQTAAAAYQKSDAALQKSDAALQKEYEVWQKEYEVWHKADLAWQKAAADPKVLALHTEICGCPWSPTTDIFGSERASTLCAVPGV